MGQRENGRQWAKGVIEGCAYSENTYKCGHGAYMIFMTGDW